MQVDRSLSIEHIHPSELGDTSESLEYRVLRLSEAGSHKLLSEFVWMVSI